MPKDREFDLHVWAKPGNEYMRALYTVSIGEQAICIDLTIDGALAAISNKMEEAVHGITSSALLSR